jgi:hypothetical protein
MYFLRFIRIAFAACRPSLLPFCAVLRASPSMSFALPALAPTPFGVSTNLLTTSSLLSALFIELRSAPIRQKVAQDMENFHIKDIATDMNATLPTVG